MLTLAEGVRWQTAEREHSPQGEWPMVRWIVAVICGSIAGGVFNIATIMLSWTIYRPPEGTNLSDPATMNTYIQSLPLPAFLMILVANAGGALVGGLVAAVIARRSPLVLGA